MNSPSLPLAEPFDLRALNAAVVGGTGMAGQAFVLTLDGTGDRVAAQGHSPLRGTVVAGEAGGDARYALVKVAETESAVDAAQSLPESMSSLQVLVNAVDLSPPSAGSRRAT